MYRFFIGVLLASLSTSALSTEVTTEGNTQPQPKPNNPKWPAGDYHYCLVDNLPYRLEALPGLGWDNLRNRVSGMVTFLNYSQCKTTEDGRYLIPDDVYVTPIKESKASLNSEIIDHWSNYSSMTSTTVNVEAHESLFGSISGSFSYEYQDVKKRQFEDFAATSRVQLRYRVYAARLHPDAQLHPKFKTRLLDIGAHLQLKNMPVARYLADLLIRDYGTHYVTRVDAGGLLAKLDHISRTYMASSERTRQQTKASASASFFGAFGVSGSTSHLNTHTVSESYKKNVMDSQLYTYGGPPVRENFSIAYWEDNLINNLVAIDREGDPLHFLVTHETLPELPEEVTFNLSALVLKSLQRYYKNNAITGCIDAESPNFNFQANLDDHSCKSPFTNFTFGGVYQTCQPTGSPPTDPCVGYTQKNPKTQGYSCPSGYTAIRLHEGKLAENCKTECHGWWIFKSCNTHCGGGVYTTYWCAAEGPIAQDSGYLFGGLYSSTTNNVITKAKKCPIKFYPQRFGPKGMYVCISDDYELGAKYSLPFGGFISCSAGNPLAMTSRKGLAKVSMGSGPSAMPKHCPHGYSQHLAVIDEDCEITYCTKTNSLSSQGLPTIRRPPFHQKPTRNKAITFPLLIENNNTAKMYMRNEGVNNMWTELTAAMSMNLSQKAKEINPAFSAMKNLQLSTQSLGKAQPSDSSSSGGGLSGGATAGITIGATLLVGILIIAFFVRRRRGNTSVNEGSSNYQSFNS